MKKLLAVILSLTLLLVSVQTATVASADENECNITFSDVTAMVGSMVDVPVYLNNNPGIGGIRLTLVMPEGFSYKTKSEGGITAGSLFSDFDYGKNVLFIDTQDVTSDGLLMTVHVAVDSSVQPGEYPVTALLRQCIDTHGTNVDCEIISGTITVAAEIPVEGITLDMTEITLVEGQQITLTPTTIPANASEQGVTWKTSRSSVATVSGGTVTAVKMGTAVITVKSNYIPKTSVTPGTGSNGLPVIPLDSGYKATCKVTVLCNHNYPTTSATENYELPTCSVKGGYDQVVYCTRCGGEVSRTHYDIAATGVAENYVYITMNGDIGVNAYLDLSPFELDNFKVEVKAYDTDGSIITRTYENPSKEGAGEFANFYKFTTEVAAHNMAKDITITLYNNDQIVTEFGENGTFVTSIREIQEHYIEYYSAGGAGASDPKADKIVALCKAYLAYGARAQEFFKVDTDNLADQNYSIIDQVNAVSEGDIDAVRIMYGAATGFKIVSSTFMVTSKSSLRFYYQLTDTDIDDYTCTATLDGTAAEVRTGTNNAGQPFVEIYNIAAKDLDAETVLVITNNNDNSSLTVSYNAMCYAKSQIKSNANEKLTQICKAMYLYNQAANEYFTD